ncbi:hypothetical protein KRP22_007810 [Phytophthora ramorum]|nr:Secreted RxLR effector protein 124 [Phytophthora ramorum]
MAGPLSSSARPEFLCVDVVVREFPPVEALGHVVDQLKALLDVSKVLSVAIAAQNQPLDAQSLTLLEHAASREKKKLFHWSSELKRSYKQFQFETALNAAASRGFFAGVKWLRSKYLPKGKFHGTERAALYSGRLDMLQFLHDEFHNKMAEDVVVDTQDAVAHAAANGRLDLVQWNRSEFCTSLAGESRSVSVLQFLKKHNRLRSQLPKTSEAATRGDLELLQWLYDHDRRRFGYEAVVDEARERNHFHLLRWLETLPETGRYF